MTAIKEFKIDEKEDKKKAKEETLFVAGYFTKGPNKGKKIALSVRNTMLLNPVQPVFEAYPDIDCLLVSKSETKARKYFKKLISK